MAKDKKSKLVVQKIAELPFCDGEFVKLHRGRELDGGKIIFDAHGMVSVVVVGNTVKCLIVAGVKSEVIHWKHHADSSLSAADKARLTAYKKELVAKGTLIQISDDKLIFADTLVFSSPSAFSTFVLGCPTNGCDVLK